MRKFRKGSSWSPIDNKEYKIEDLLKRVDNGWAHLKAKYTMDNELQINICEDDYFYNGYFNMTATEFNEKYGKDYIDNWNLYL